MTPLIGKKELDRLEKLSNQPKSEREAIKEFEQFISEKKLSVL
jgi:hypothetical protein